MVVNINPTSHVASAKFKSLPLETRNCFLNDGKDDSKADTRIFKEYSKESCLYECKLNYAISKSQVKYYTVG